MSENNGNGMQLAIRTDLSTLPAAIEFNYAELKAAVGAYLERYRGLIVTEDGVRQAAVDRAEINRVASAISRARIDTKKRYLAPFEGFEAKAKELEGMLKDASGAIGRQLDAFEEAERGKKEAALMALWARKVEAATATADEAIRGSRHWEAFFRERVSAAKGSWLNKGVTLEAAGAQMDAELQRCAGVIRSVEGIFAVEDKETRARAEVAVAECMDIGRTVESMQAWKAERERIAAAKAAQAAREEAAKAAKASVAPAAAVPAAQAAPAPDGEEEADEDVVVAAPAEKRHTVTLRITGTMAQLLHVKAAMVAAGVEFEKV